jgi:hypothetical protein
MNRLIAMGINDAGFVPDFGSFFRDPRYFVYQFLPSSIDWGTIAGWLFLALLVIVGAIILIVYLLRKPISPPPPSYYPHNPMNPVTPAYFGQTFQITHANGLRQSLPMTMNRMIIGRNPMCQIQLQDFKVSDQHAEIFIQDGRYFVRDLGSANGAYVNGCPINTTVEIFTGSYIQMGNSTIQL